jgi:glutamate synthase (NADPH/NADH) small chain
MTLKTSSSHEEGAERHWAIAYQNLLLADGNGNLKALKIVRS